jgi:hypothetical protein
LLLTAGKRPAALVNTIAQSREQREHTIEIARKA